MIERGSGVTTDFGGTNWSLLDVPTIWATLSDHDTENHWRLVSGWRRTCDLTRAHLDRLTEYRDRLTAAWPPERSAASREYVGRLNHLIDSLRQTHDVAAANYDTFSAATTAIGATRTKLRGIHDEYVTKSQHKQEQDRAKQLEAIGVPDLHRRNPPVTDVDLQRLNTQARELMLGLSGELRQAQAQLKQPPPRNSGTSVKPDDNPDIYGAGNPPPIPPVTPVPISQSGRNPSRENRLQSVQQFRSPTAPGIGPILGSAGTIVTPTPASPIPPGLNSPVPPLTAGGVGGLTPALPPGIGGLRPGVGASPYPVRGIEPTKPGMNTSPVARGLPPGGMIGGTPGTAFGQPSAGTAPARRINPVGGVIGNGGAGTGPMGSAGQRPGTSTGRTPMVGGRGTPPLGMMPGATDRRQTEDSEGRRWDPDHPWEVIEGVDPVVRPPNEPGRIDPGPAIGFDR